MSYPIHGLYAIADATLPAFQDPGNAVTLALRGGASIIQYRNKGKDTVSRQEEAEALLQICRQYQVPLIINDDILLAAKVGADGVHLGRDDPPVAMARQLLGREAIIGVSCYNQLKRAITAEQAGADYVAFGRCFPSATKPEAVHAPLWLLRKARKRLSLPVVAIGGITPENASQAISAGAHAVAVIGGLFKHSDIEAAARAYGRLFSQQEVRLL